MRSGRWRHACAKYRVMTCTTSMMQRQLSIISLSLFAAGAHINSSLLTNDQNTSSIRTRMYTITTAAELSLYTPSFHFCHEFEYNHATESGKCNKVRGIIVNVLVTVNALFCFELITWSLYCIFPKCVSQKIWKNDIKNDVLLFWLPMYIFFILLYFVSAVHHACLCLSVALEVAQ